jgi:hypothetical protein
MGVAFSSAQNLTVNTEENAERLRAVSVNLRPVVGDETGGKLAHVPWIGIVLHDEFEGISGHAGCSSRWRGKNGRGVPVAA